MALNGLNILSKDWERGISMPVLVEIASTFAIDICNVQQEF